MKTRPALAALKLPSFTLRLRCQHTGVLARRVPRAAYQTDPPCGEVGHSGRAPVAHAGMSSLRRCDIVLDYVHW
jgi:hypothetical protein